MSGPEADRSGLIDRVGSRLEKLAPRGTDGRLFTTDVSAKFKVT